MIISENTQRFAGGKAMAKPYAEIAYAAPRREDKRTGDEIAADVIRRAGLIMN